MDCKLFFPLCMSAFLLSSCMEEHDAGLNCSDMVVSFIISGDEQTTKAAQSFSRELIPFVVDPQAAAETDDIKLYESVSSIDESLATKGIPVYSENISSISEKIAVSAYRDSEPWGKADRLYSSNGSVWSYNYSSREEDGNLRWPDGDALCFYLKVPVSADGCSNIVYSGGEIGFEYSSPKSTDGTGDAAAQKDILFSSRSLEFSEKTSEKNKIRLFHALTAVKFKNGSPEINIVGVIFNNLYSKGKCTISPDHSLTSDDCTSWSDLSARTQFAQAFGETLVSVSKEDKKGTSFADSFYAGQTSQNNLNDASFEQTFMLIPQKLDGATMTIYYIYGGEVKSQTVRLDGREWKPGELRTFTLTFTETGVEVKDNVSSETQTKSDVKITNTGNTPSYIRAAFVANWMNDSGAVFNIPWDETQGRFSGLPGTGWVKGTDGFWYYGKVVGAGATISHDLFLSYEAPAAPADGIHLEMTIVAQSVPASRIYDAKAEGWGAGVDFSSVVD